MSRYLWPMALAIFLILYFFLGERLPYNGGLGFDGYFYGTLAQDVPGVLGKGIPDYYLDRILPSLIIWLSAKATGLSLTTADQVVDAFHIYNSLLLVGAALLWVRLSRTLELSAEVTAIGVASLFLNWTVLKQFEYFAVQTDATALAAGVLASLCVIERRYLLLAFVGVLTSFAFKAVMPLVAPLILFVLPAPEKAPPRFSSWLPAATTALAVTIILYAIFWKHFQIAAGGAPVDFAALPLSIAIVAFYVYYVVRSVPVVRIVTSCRLAAVKAIGVFVMLWGVRAAVLAVMARAYANGIQIVDLKSFFLGTAVVSVAKPGVFLIAHVTVFGPAFVLFLWYLRLVIDAAARHSAGAALFMMAVLALGFDSESRAMTFAYPLIVTFLCIALQQLAINRTFAAAFVVCSLLLSRCYLPLNALGMAAIGPGPLKDLGALLLFPWQWVIMNIGPWMGWVGYVANLMMTGLVTIVLLALRPVAGPVRAP
jgi:hypothetical protein